MLRWAEKFTNFPGRSSIQSSPNTQPTGGAVTTTDLDTNKDVVRAFVAAWNDRDFERFDTLMAAGAVLSVGGVNVPCDPKGTRAIAQEWTTAFPDWRFELLGLVAEGDRVVAHMPYSGTFTRPN